MLISVPKIFRKLQQYSKYDDFEYKSQKIFAFLHRKFERQFVVLARVSDEKWTEMGTFTKTFFF